MNFQWEAIVIQEGVPEVRPVRGQTSGVGSGELGTFPSESSGQEEGK